MKEYRTPSSVESEDLAIDDSEPVPLGYETLGEQYGLEDMDIFAPSDQQDQTIEQEYQSYVTERLSSAGTSTIKFWEVSSTRLHLALLKHSDPSTGQRKDVPNTLRYRRRLSTHSGICRAIGAGIFLQWRDRHEEAQSHQPCSNGSTTDA